MINTPSAWQVLSDYERFTWERRNVAFVENRPDWQTWDAVWQRAYAALERYSAANA
ncbi:hypothetical protein [Paraburkholderia sp. DHOC27]|uniref:hypothetical protein n=1 Tax=Paraburkholderia sp. DHOC27 TaxID=2303330 RepID=UPI0015F30DA3|nr:hypothetical protein [Paraburkholderia sp. DHOC27]